MKITTEILKNTLMELMPEQTLDITEEKINELDDIVIELSKTKFRHEDSINEMWEKFKCIGMCIICTMKEGGRLKEKKEKKTNGHFFNLKNNL